MIDVALTFLVKNLNTYLKSRTGSDFGAAELSRLVDDSGKWAIDSEHLGATLINIEEERVFKGQGPETTYVNGKLVVLEPPLRLDLHVLFASNLKQYELGLKFSRTCSPISRRTLPSRRRSIPISIRASIGSR